MLSSLFIIILGFYQLSWENHQSSTIRVVSALYVFCGLSSFLNHFHNTRTYLLLENFAVYLIQYIMLSIILETYLKNVLRLLRRSISETDTSSQILSGIIWSFSSFCIYFLLYHELSGCDTSPWLYRLGYTLPIIVQALCVAHAYFLDNQYSTRVGMLCHDEVIAKEALTYWTRGTSMVFIGLFVWILIHATCAPARGIEYIPAHAVWHVLFAYGYLLICQYYIFLSNDLKGRPMTLSSRMPNVNALCNVMFPYFMSYQGIYKEETEQMLKDANAGGMSLKSEPQIVDLRKASNVSHPNPLEIKDLKTSITTLNSERKARKALQKKLKEEQRRKAQQAATYNDFDLDEYIGSQTGINQNYVTPDNEDFANPYDNDVQLEMAETQKKSNNDVVEEETAENA